MTGKPRDNHHLARHPSMPRLPDSPMSFRILVGDCRDSLKSLADQSVQCCVTSPPYYGLRDYGHAAQLGLEKTPAEYVEKMVGVFREVRRVLRDDGTLWLNIGSSYASSGGERDYGSYDGVTGRGPGARRYRNAPACGTDGKALQGFPATGSSYSDLCDGCRDAIRNHHGRTAGSGQHPEPSERPDERTVRGTVPSASWSEGKAVELPSALASTTLESSPQPPVVCSHCSNCGACLSVLRSVLRDSRLCVRSSVYSDGIARILPLSGVRNGDREPSFSAYSNIASLRFKPKDLIPIPWMLAMALQADGWYLRSDIIWAKPNPMPESVTDRPTKSHEYLFLLSKSATYYYDAEAIAEPSQDVGTVNSFGNKNAQARRVESLTGNMRAGVMYETKPTRNRRSVWSVNPTPFREAHFATFPPKLIEPCILAGSARQACEHCGKAWERIVEKETSGVRNTSAGNSNQQVHRPGVSHDLGMRPSLTLGFAPSCDCGSTNPVPSTVLDPFGGAGTTGLVADRLGRDSILCELNEKYAEMARKRITDDAPLFAERLGA